MPRRLKQKRVLHLVKRGQASYTDGKVSKPVSIIDKAISAPNPVIQQDSGVLQACASISQSLVALKADLAKLDTKPDLSKLDEISANLLALTDTLSAPKPKEWVFDVIRDELGKPIRVKAKEVK